MIAPRWRKVLRDVLGQPGRSALAIVAIAAGVFEIGAMLYKYALLQPELRTMYGKTTPASATLITDSASDGLVDSVSRIPGVAAAEARPVVVARAQIGDGEWIPAILYVVRDFDRQKLDTFTPERGAWPPPPGAVLLERSAIQVARKTVGEPLRLRLPGGSEQDVTIAGTVHAAGLAPAWMEHMIPGFVSWSSTLRGFEESAQIRIRTTHPFNEGQVQETVDAVKAMLEASGHPVTRTTLHGTRHPHADQMESFLFLLLWFGILSFLLSVILVAGMVHALMAEQVRQVGIMKAIGATSRQIAGMFLGQVSLLALAALAVGIPLGLWVGRGYAEFAAGILNANLGSRPFPWWLVLAEVLVGLLIPLLVAMGPVRKAARITVRQALSDDPASRPFGASRLERWFAAQRWLPRPLALSLRTTLTRRGRLALTVGTLAVGGAVFMSSLNVAAAWNRSVEADFASRRYDLQVGLSSPHPASELRELLAAVPEVERVEFWPGASPYLIGEDGVAGATVALLGPDPGSRLLALPVLEGRWLTADDREGAVINQAVRIRNPSLRVGDDVQVRIEGRTVAFPIVGVVKELAPMPVIYAAQPAVYAATGWTPDLASSMRIVTRRHDAEGQLAAARALEAAFEANGMEVRGMHRLQDQKQGILDHLVIIMAILTMAAVIVVFVGSIGLASTLTLSVVQRTREIGVLGAIGARPSVIARQVWFEAVLMGLASWVCAAVLAAPASWILQAACGRIFFRIPLDFHMSPLALGAWLALVMVLATICSLAPARRATRLPVREALGYS